MRYMFFVMFLVASGIAGADVSHAGPSAKKSDDSQVEFLRRLSKTIEQSGFKKVQIIPQMFVAVVENQEGKSSVLVVDSTTLKAFEVDGALDVVDQSTREAKPSESTLTKLH